jgi:hypothetical protein
MKMELYKADAYVVRRKGTQEYLGWLNKKVLFREGVSAAMRFQSHEDAAGEASDTEHPQPLEVVHIQITTTELAE